MHPTWLLTLSSVKQIGATSDFKTSSIDIEVIGTQEEAIKIAKKFEDLMRLTNTGCPKVSIREEERT